MSSYDWASDRVLARKLPTIAKKLQVAADAILKLETELMPVGESARDNRPMLRKELQSLAEYCNRQAEYRAKP